MKKTVPWQIEILKTQLDWVMEHGYSLAGYQVFYKDTYPYPAEQLKTIWQADIAELERRMQSAALKVRRTQNEN